jgi:hypothetical protein
MVSPTLSQLLERARVRFGVEVEIFDARLNNLYPEGGTDLSRVIEDSSAVRSALMDALAAGRPHRLDGGGLHYRIYPLSRSKRRQPTGLMAIRRNQSDPAHALDAEPWSDLARAIVEADLAASDSLGEERERSLLLVGALRFLEFVIDTDDEAAMTRALVQAAAVWYDVDARVYRRSLSGDLVLHTWLPGVQPDSSANVLSAHLVGNEVTLSRIESWGGLGADGTAHEAVLVPLTTGDRAQWVLALFGVVPPEGDTVLRLIGRVAGARLAELASRRTQAARTTFESLLTDTTKAPELLAMRIVHELAQMAKASSASLTLVRKGLTRRIAAIGSLGDSALSESPVRLYSGDRFVRTLPLGADDRAVLEMRPASGTSFTTEGAEACEASVSVLQTWLLGSLASFDAPNVIIDHIVPLSPAFSERIQEELERARRFDLRLALVRIDVAAPTEAVSEIQEALRRELRGSDVTGKMSGSLVVALLTHTDAMGLDNVVRRLKQRLADAAERLNVSDLRLGQAAVSPEVRTADALLALALRQAEPLIVH